MFHRIVDRMSIVALIFEPYYRVKFQGLGGPSGALRSWSDKVPRDLARGMKELFGGAALPGNWRGRFSLAYSFTNG